MTVPTTATTVTYTGNGATTAFPFPFKITSKTQLQAYKLDAATGELVTTYTSADYSVSGVGDDEGGTLTLSGPALSTSYKLLIVRSLPLTQDTEVGSQSGFDPEAVEDGLDILEMQIQQINTAVETLSAQVEALADAEDTPLPGFDLNLRADLADVAGARLVGYSFGYGTEPIPPRTVLDKLRERVNVKDYGAVGNGLTDDTEAVQQAIDAAGENYVLVFTSGTYLVGQLTIPSRARWSGDNKVEIKCGMEPAISDAWITHAGAVEDGAYITDIQFNYALNSNVREIIQLGDNPRNWIFEGCQFKNMNGGPALKGRYLTAEDGDGFITIRNCLFVNGDNSSGAIQINASVYDLGVRAIRIESCEFYNVEGKVIELAMDVATNDSTLGRFGTFEQTVITNCYFGPGAASCAMDLRGHDYAQVQVNVMDGGSYGIIAHYLRNSLLNGNHFLNATISAINAIYYDGLSIVGNAARFCNKFFDDDEYYGYLLTADGCGSNLIITNNRIRDTGLGAYTADKFFIQFSVLHAPGYGRAKILIANNIFNNPTYLTGCIRTEGCKDFKITGNLFTAENVNDGVTFVYTHTGETNFSIDNNHILLKQNYTTTSPSYADVGYSCVIRVIPGASERKGSFITRNTITSQGLVGEEEFVGIGSASTATGGWGEIAITDNVLIGTFGYPLNINDNGGRAVVLRNDFTLAVNFNYATGYYIKNRRELESSGIPTTGTFFLGDRVHNIAATVGQPKAWVCSVAGTFGTLVGITGSINNGSKVLTVNDTTGLTRGMYINVVGVTGPLRIRSINGLAVYVTTAADATVAAAAVSYQAPILTSEGNL